jgi:hypothetical protein
MLARDFRPELYPHFPWGGLRPGGTVEVSPGLQSLEGFGKGLRPVGTPEAAWLAYPPNTSPHALPASRYALPGTAGFPICCRHWLSSRVKERLRL